MFHSGTVKNKSVLGFLRHITLFQCVLNIGNHANGHQSQMGYTFLSN